MSLFLPLQAAANAANNSPNPQIPKITKSPTHKSPNPLPLLYFYRSWSSFLLRDNMTEIPYGTLDLMVLKTLAGLGPLHGYGIARRIEQVAQGALALNQGTIYPALLRLEQKGWIKSDWGTSENNRRARFYVITAAGRRRLAAETDF